MNARKTLLAGLLTLGTVAGFGTGIASLTACGGHDRHARWKEGCEQHRQAKGGAVVDKSPEKAPEKAPEKGPDEAPVTDSPVAAPAPTPQE